MSRFGSLKPREVLRALRKAGFFIHDSPARTCN